MKKSVLLLMFILCALFIQAQELTTFILTRHAEKADDGTRNPPLNEKGLTRAQNLAALLSNQEIAALYSTPYNRTEQTLQPLATMNGMEIVSYDPYAKEEWLSELIQKHEGKSVVISGHSNTIPLLANALLGSETFSQFDDTDYSNLIIITATEVGRGKLIRLMY